MSYGDFVHAKLSQEYDFEAFDMQILDKDPSYIQYKLKLQWINNIIPNINKQ